MVRSVQHADWLCAYRVTLRDWLFCMERFLFVYHGKQGVSGAFLYLNNACFIYIIVVCFCSFHNIVKNRYKKNNTNINKLII